MNNSEEQTEWSDLLRKRGILAPKTETEFSENDIIELIEDTVQCRVKCDDDKNHESDDSIDSDNEDLLREYRRKRLAEMKAELLKKKFGDVLEISGPDYVQEVNNAGTAVWVVIHLYKEGISLCTLINHYLNVLASKYPYTKFIKAISTTCVPNYPDHSLPSIFVYLEGSLKIKYIGHMDLRAPRLSIEEFEYLIGKSGAIETQIVDDPREQVRDKLFTDLRNLN